MPSLISNEHVRLLAADLFGLAAVRVTRLPGSVANQDFLIEDAGEPRLVLKAGPAAEIAAEAWACARLASIGMPVPRVLVSDLDPSRLGSPYLVAGFVAGEPSEHGEVMRDAGAWFRRAHDLELPGWGPVTVGSGTVTAPGVGGRHACWRDAIEADLAGVPALVEAGVLEEGLAGLACRMVSTLEYDGQGVLLHNDLKPAHLFGLADRERQQLSAVIDWGDASVGDPAADLARLSMTGPAATTAFLEGYQVRLTDDLADRLTRYRILWNLRALSYEFQAGGDWFDAYRDRIREDTAR